MDATPVRPNRLLLATAIVLVAFNLRPALSSMGPVLPEVLRGTGLTTGQSWLLTTLPIVCLGVFGLAAPWAARRLGSGFTILACVFAMAAALLLRASDEAAVLVLSGVIVGAAIGIGNVLLPAVLKREFADKAAVMTGVYTMALCGGAAIAAGATAPLEVAFGGRWTAALAAWALPAFLAGLAWAPFARRIGKAAPPSPSLAGSLWRDRLAWQVTLFMGLQSSLAYCVFAWLAPILRDRGLSAVEAGFVVSASVLVQAPAALFAPALATRGKDQRLAVLAVVGLSLGGLLGCLFAPLGSLPLWALVLGLGQGASFAVALTIVVLRAPDAYVAARLSSMSQGVGYTIAAAGPLLMGLLHEWTGDWAATGVMFVVIAVGACVAGVGAGREAFVRPSLPRRAPGEA